MIESELDLSSNLIDALSNCTEGCSSDDDTQSPTAKRALSSWTETPEKGVSQSPEKTISFDLSRAIKVFSGPSADTTVEDAQFDDLKYWIRLPLPINAIPPEAQAIIQSTSPSVTPDQKKQTFAKYLYQHWVQRQDSARCHLYRDCLNQQQQYAYYRQILRSFYNDPLPALVVEKKVQALPTYQKILTISPCIQVRVRNSRSAMAPNSFKLTELDGNDKPTVVDIPERPGENSADQTLPESATARDILIESWYGFSGPFFSASKTGMVSNSVHYSGSLNTAVWFQDPGSSASVGPNLVVYLQATPDPGFNPSCNASLQKLKTAVE
jgi:hypothetical protein